MADYFEIHDEDFASLKDKVIVVTGCASGIGLATTKLFLSSGARVVAGDLNAPSIDNPNLTFQTTNVASWSDLTGLFRLALTTHGGRIDHVFANAGIGPRANYLELQTDPSGQPLEPSHDDFDVNLRGVVNTSALAFHYMKKQQSDCSVVVTASASAFQRFSFADYASAKHGVLGFMRGMTPVLTNAGLPIRINAISPSWTVTGLLPEGVTEQAGSTSQSPEVVARGVAVLMADESRHGQLIYTAKGRHREIDVSILLKAKEQLFEEDDVDDDIVRGRIVAILEARQEQEKVTSLE